LPMHGAGLLLAVALVPMVAVLASPAWTCSASTPLHVTMRVFSGTRDPTWVLTRKQSLHLRTVVLANVSHAALSYVSSTRVMGYKGMVVACPHAVRGVLIAQLPRVEEFLLQTNPKLEVDAHMLSHVRAVMKGASESVLSTNPALGDLTIVQPKDGGRGQCAVPVLGPDTPPVYNPDTDCQGCFETDQYQNNCYNYGSDIVTDTFAQPGRGSGHKWTVNTCDDMTRAAESDGLKFYGTDLPTKQPDKGHFVALFIWPDTNFHWIRRDSDVYWSHKPGGTPVRNTDNSGSVITDPRASDFAPWTQFCSFFVVIPSNVTVS